VRATRRFARKQESWFGRDPRIEWQPADRVAT
jgi:tRNA dimethylallyltransferase